MSEKCLIAASVAALICHPSSSIKIFKSTPKPQTQNPPKKKHKPKSHESSFSFSDGDWHVDTVASMFRYGWPIEKVVVIEKILKVNYSRDFLRKFEQQRERVKSRSKMCAIDGNELIRFHGALITCSLGKNAASSSCSNKSCSVCRLLTSVNDASNSMTTFYENSWRAHGNIGTASVVDSASARTAVIICKVIAGRIANCNEFGVGNIGEGGRFDSVELRAGNQSSGSEELVVLNQRAVLPCFVVIYRAN